MKCLSIKQPWAHLILFHKKDIENRTWKTNFRGRIAIHASMKLDESACGVFDHLIPDELKVGCLLGTVEIVDCVSESTSKWFQGPYGFVLRNPQPLSCPIKYKGRLGLFDLNLEAERKIQIC